MRPAANASGQRGDAFSDELWNLARKPQELAERARAVMEARLLQALGFPTIQQEAVSPATYRHLAALMMEIHAALAALTDTVRGTGDVPGDADIPQRINAALRAIESFKTAVRSALDALHDSATVTPPVAGFIGRIERFLGERPTPRLLGEWRLLATLNRISDGAHLDVSLLFTEKPITATATFDNRDPGDVWSETKARCKVQRTIEVPAFRKRYTDGELLGAHGNLPRFRRLTLGATEIQQLWTNAAQSVMEGYKGWSKETLRNPGSKFADRSMHQLATAGGASLEDVVHSNEALLQWVLTGKAPPKTDSTTVADLGPTIGNVPTLLTEHLSSGRILRSKHDAFINDLIKKLESLIKIQGQPTASFIADAIHTFSDAAFADTDVPMPTVDSTHVRDDVLSYCSQPYDDETAEQIAAALLDLALDVPFKDGVLQNAKTLIQARGEPPKGTLKIMSRQAIPQLYDHIRATCPSWIPSPHPEITDLGAYVRLWKVVLDGALSCIESWRCAALPPDIVGVIKNAAGHYVALATRVRTLEVSAAYTLPDAGDYEQELRNLFPQSDSDVSTPPTIVSVPGNDIATEPNLSAWWSSTREEALRRVTVTIEPAGGTLKPAAFAQELRSTIGTLKEASTGTPLPTSEETVEPWTDALRAHVESWPKTVTVENVTLTVPPELGTFVTTQIDHLTADLLTMTWRKTPVAARQTEDGAEGTSGVARPAQDSVETGMPGVAKRALVQYASTFVGLSRIGGARTSELVMVLDPHPQQKIAEWDKRLLQSLRKLLGKCPPTLTEDQCVKVLQELRQQYSTGGAPLDADREASVPEVAPVVRWHAEDIGNMMKELPTWFAKETRAVASAAPVPARAPSESPPKQMSLQEFRGMLYGAVKAVVDQDLPLNQRDGKLYQAQLTGLETMIDLALISCPDPLTTDNYHRLAEETTITHFAFDVDGRVDEAPLPPDLGPIIKGKDADSKRPITNFSRRLERAFQTIISTLEQRLNIPTVPRAEVLGQVESVRGSPPLSFPRQIPAAVGQEDRTLLTGMLQQLEVAVGSALPDHVGPLLARRYCRFLSNLYQARGHLFRRVTGQTRERDGGVWEQAGPILTAGVMALFPTIPELSGVTEMGSVETAYCMGQVLSAIRRAAPGAYQPISAPEQVCLHNMNRHVIERLLRIAQSPGATMSPEEATRFLVELLDASRVLTDPILDVTNTQKACAAVGQVLSTMGTFFAKRFPREFVDAEPLREAMEDKEGYGDLVIPLEAHIGSLDNVQLQSDYGAEKMVLDRADRLASALLPSPVCRPVWEKIMEPYCAVHNDYVTALGALGCDEARQATTLLEEKAAALHRTADTAFARQRKYPNVPPPPATITRASVTQYLVKTIQRYEAVRGPTTGYDLRETLERSIPRICATDPPVLKELAELADLWEILILAPAVTEGNAQSGEWMAEGDRTTRPHLEPAFACLLETMSPQLGMTDASIKYRDLIQYKEKGSARIPVEQYRDAVLPALEPAAVRSLVDAHSVLPTSKRKASQCNPNLQAALMRLFAMTHDAVECYILHGFPEGMADGASLRVFWFGFTLMTQALDLFVAHRTMREQYAKDTRTASKRSEAFLKAVCLHWLAATDRGLKLSRPKTAEATPEWKAPPIPAFVVQSIFVSCSAPLVMDEAIQEEVRRMKDGGDWDKMTQAGEERDRALRTYVATIPPSFERKDIPELLSRIDELNRKWLEPFEKYKEVTRGVREQARKIREALESRLSAWFDVPAPGEVPLAQVQELLLAAEEQGDRRYLEISGLEVSDPNIMRSIRTEDVRWLLHHVCPDGLKDQHNLAELAGTFIGRWNGAVVQPAPDGQKELPSDLWTLQGMEALAYLVSRCVPHQAPDDVCPHEEVVRTLLKKDDGEQTGDSVRRDDAVEIVATEMAAFPGQSIKKMGTKEIPSPTTWKRPLQALTEAFRTFASEWLPEVMRSEASLYAIIYFWMEAGVVMIKHVLQTEALWTQPVEKGLEAVFRKCLKKGTSRMTGLEDAIPASDADSHESSAEPIDYTDSTLSHSLPAGFGEQLVHSDGLTRDQILLPIIAITERAKKQGKALAGELSVPIGPPIGTMKTRVKHFGRRCNRVANSVTEGGPILTTTDYEKLLRGYGWAITVSCAGSEESPETPGLREWLIKELRQWCVTVEGSNTPQEERPDPLQEAVARAVAETAASGGTAESVLVDGIVPLLARTAVIFLQRVAGSATDQSTTVAAATAVQNATAAAEQAIIDAIHATCTAGTPSKNTPTAITPTATQLRERLTTVIDGTILSDTGLTADQQTAFRREVLASVVDRVADEAATDPASLFAASDGETLDDELPDVMPPPEAPALDTPPRRSRPSASRVVERVAGNLQRERTRRKQLASVETAEGTAHAANILGARIGQWVTIAKQREHPEHEEADAVLEASRRLLAHLLQLVPDPPQE